MTISLKLQRRMAHAILALMITMAAGCGDLLLGPDPGDGPEENFEILWQTFDRHYAHFDLKGIDWHALYAEHRPRIDASTTDDELFEVMSEMLGHLNDGHVYLSAADRRFYSDLYTRHARRNFNREHVSRSYLRTSERAVGEGNITYGWASEDIGYIRISTLAGGTGYGNDVRGWMREIDRPLREFGNARGLILDLRNNSGGRAFNAQYLAGRFATGRKLFAVTRSRNGPGYNDFSKPTEWFVEPTGDFQFTRPIVVLTNSFSFSAAEWMTLALKEFDHVTHMGTNSGGGLAMFLPRELPNGWTFTVSVQQTRCSRGHSYEIVGVPPDLFVEIGEHDAALGRDTILEEAIRYLEGR